MRPLANTRRIWSVAVLPLLDFAAVLLGSALVYLVRYRWFSRYSVFSDVVRLGRADYIVASVVFALVVVVTFALLGLYPVRTRLSVWQTLSKIASGIFFVLLVVIAFLFFDEFNRSFLPDGVNVSRFILATGGFFILYTVLAGRFFLWLGRQFLYLLGIGQVRLLLVAREPTKLEAWLNSRNDVSEVLVVRKLTKATHEEITALLESREVAEVYLYSNQSKYESEIALLTERYKIPFVFRPVGFGQYSAFDLKPLVIGGHTLIEVQHTALNGWWVVLKRLFDIVFASTFLVVFSWLYALLILAIKLDSPGSAFYLNERVGPDGKPFRLFKFRRFKPEFCTDQKNPEALRIEAELIKSQNLKQGDGPLYKIKDDPRMTRVGKFLEKTSLDELPQFLNVLFGSMSVVGPRPHQPREVAKYQLHHYKVLNIKPGITGLAQINGRSDLSFEQEVFFDTYYVEHWNPLWDLFIILKTPFVLLFKRHRA